MAIIYLKKILKCLNTKTVAYAKAVATPFSGEENGEIE